MVKRGQQNLAEGDNMHGRNSPCNVESVALIQKTQWDCSIGVIAGLCTFFIAQPRFAHGPQQPPYNCLIHNIIASLKYLRTLTQNYPKSNVYSDSVHA